MSRWIIECHSARPTWCAPAKPPAVDPNAFVHIGSDDSVTVLLKHSEMGQGVWTTLPLVLLLTAGTVIAQLLGPSPFARLLAWQRRCSMVELFGTWALAALVLLALGPFDVPHTLYFRF